MAGAAKAPRSLGRACSSGPQGRCMPSRRKHASSRHTAQLAAQQGPSQSAGSPPAPLDASRQDMQFTTNRCCLHVGRGRLLYHTTQQDAGTQDDRNTSTIISTSTFHTKQKEPDSCSPPCLPRCLLHTICASCSHPPHMVQQWHSPHLTCAVAECICHWTVRGTQRISLSRDRIGSKFTSCAQRTHQY